MLVEPKPLLTRFARLPGLDGVQATTPYNFMSIVNGHHEVDAPVDLAVGGAPVGVDDERSVGAAREAMPAAACATKNCSSWARARPAPASPTSSWPPPGRRASARPRRASAGWLGITMPVALGGAGLGVTEAAIMMQAVARAVLRHRLLIRPEAELERYTADDAIASALASVPVPRGSAAT